MKKVITIFSLLLFFSSVSIAQIGSSPDVESRPAASSGTYQFIYKDRASEEVINLSSSQLAQLETLRDNTATKYIRFSEATIIKLPSKQEITSASFVPLTSKLYIVEESNYQDYHNLVTVPFE
jgi:hypothetical protein